ncbi:DUF7670 domain-containing protein [Lutimonas sp.]|uniref:DUF7670 domain-containing protein n=1 Tax=Lutimonas sp. TaxID=1872403 RepID=UPI003C768A13
MILLIAWKRELFGGIIFLIIGIVISPLVDMHNYRMNGSVGTSLLIIATITFPFILAGVLFILGYLNKRKKAKLID